MGEGIEMLESKMQYQQSQLQVNALENRIKRLIFEDERSNKLASVANQKAAKLLKARERRFQELQLKFQLQQKKKENEEKQRQINQSFRDVRRTRIQEVQEYILNEKITTRERLQHQFKEQASRRIIEEVNDLLKKQEVKQTIEFKKNHFIKIKQDSQDIITGYQRQAYQQSLQENEQRAQKNKEKVKYCTITHINHQQLQQLEQIEKLLIDKLGQTQVSQNEALQNLHTAVQKCNSGININNLIQATNTKTQRNKLRIDSNSFFITNSNSNDLQTSNNFL